MADSLRFEFEAISAQGNVADGWGRGILYWCDEPYWHAGADDGESVDWLEWTWVDLLQFLADNWIYLVGEQVLPLPWLQGETGKLHTIWNIADEHWQNVSTERADEDERVLIRFMERHNLAAAWQGIYVPALYWLRVGDEIGLTTEDGTSIRAPFAEVRSHLEDLGEKMADAWRESTNPRVRQAVRAWENRKEIPLAVAVAISAGLPESEVEKIQGSHAANDFWGIDSVDALLAGADTEMLAAARMSRNVLESEQIEAIIGQMRKYEHRSTPALDRLADQATATRSKWSHLREFEQGYWLANWLREKLVIGRDAGVDPEKVLLDWLVEVVELDIGSTDIDAIACWGAHGPAIFVNVGEEWRARYPQRRRSTLAHEICHLLVDRRSALPLAEVLGGDVDVMAERRANAFSAEFLLPRSAAREVFLRSHDLRSAVDQLTQAFDVSRRLVAHQIENSHLPLSAAERQQLAIMTALASKRY